MTMRHVCSWQHQSTSRGRWHCRGSLWSWLAIWARNCSCLDCCINWT
ncbi:hypothetical protein LEMLEM_LOCUS986 [Lemmus lemmus]